MVAVEASGIRSGELVVWLKPVAITRAVVRRDGRVQAAGHPADHTQLGAAVAVPARRGRRAGQPVHPREISFTAARRAIIASVRSGAATASLPTQMITAHRERILADLARRRVQVSRHRHRDRKTKARPGFPPGGPRLATRTAPAQISVCQPLTA